MEYGAFQYLIKPVEIDRLRAVVGRAISFGRIGRLKRQCAEEYGSGSFYVGDRAGIDAGIDRQKTGDAGRNVSSLSFHSLRHSFTSALANAGVPADVRKKLTGHADAKSHATYSHHELETIRGAVEKIAALPKKTV